VRRLRASLSPRAKPYSSETHIDAPFHTVAACAQVVADYLADPLVFSGPARAKFAHITKGAIEDTMSHVRPLTLPTQA
jgi:hypothetical protein